MSDGDREDASSTKRLPLDRPDSLLLAQQLGAAIAEYRLPALEHWLTLLQDDERPFRIAAEAIVKSVLSAGERIRRDVATGSVATYPELSRERLAESLREISQQNVGDIKGGNDNDVDIASPWQTIAECIAEALLQPVVTTSKSTVSDRTDVDDSLRVCQSAITEAMLFHEGDSRPTARCGTRIILDVLQETTAALRICLQRYADSWTARVRAYWEECETKVPAAAVPPISLPWTPASLVYESGNGNTKLISPAFGAICADGIKPL